MKYCKECGHEMNDEMNVCPICGHKEYVKKASSLPTKTVLKLGNFNFSIFDLCLILCVGVHGLYFLFTEI